MFKFEFEIIVNVEDSSSKRQLKMMLDTKISGLCFEFKIEV